MRCFVDATYLETFGLKIIVFVWIRWMNLIIELKLILNQTEPPAHSGLTCWYLSFLAIWSSSLNFDFNFWLETWDWMSSSSLIFYYIRCALNPLYSGPSIQMLADGNCIHKVLKCFLTCTEKDTLTFEMVTVVWPLLCLCWYTYSSSSFLGSGNFGHHKSCHWVWVPTLIQTWSTENWFCLQHLNYEVLLDFQLPQRKLFFNDLWELCKSGSKTKAIQLSVQ